MSKDEIGVVGAFIYFTTGGTSDFMRNNQPEVIGCIILSYNESACSCIILSYQKPKFSETNPCSYLGTQNDDSKF
jgi:hypothetical protein